MIKLDLYISDKPKKKYYVEFTNPETNRFNRIYFGASGYSDYTINKNDDKKNRYIARHIKRENWNELNPGSLSRYLLWNKKTLKESILDMNNRFNNIKIIDKTKSDNIEGGINIDKIINQKPSAYRSMRLAKYGLTKKPQKKDKNELKKWTNEKWQNLTALITDGIFKNCGDKGKIQRKLDLPSVCRPSIKIDNKTSKPLVKDLTMEQIKKAIKIKQSGKNRINWQNL